MKAIYASKLYKSKSMSGRDNIKSAIEDPINSELLLQLAEYLDEEYQELLNTPEPEDTKEDKVDDKDVEVEPSENFDISNLDTSSTEDGKEINEIDESTNSEDIKEDESTNSSTKLDKSSILSQTVLNPNCIVSEINLKGLADELKGTLNMREDTSGVARIALKEAELWIYYNDNINLNTIMTQVIETLSAASYTYLQFNRLARTDNAIVFTVNEVDTQNQIDTISTLTGIKENDK